MDHPVLVPSNEGNGNQWNHNQTYTKQPPATTEQKNAHPLHKNLTVAAVLKK